jgi:hypothetical protein
MNAADFTPDCRRLLRTAEPDDDDVRHGSMRQLAVVYLCALALASCSNATPAPRIEVATQGPVSAATRPPNLYPVAFAAPDACPQSSLDVVGAVTRWTFYCRFDVAQTRDFAEMLRLRIVAQGWGECAPLRFTKDELAMAIQLAPAQGGFVLAQWERNTVC